MKQDHVDLESAYRDQWLALLDKNGVRRPVALQVIAVPGIVAQITKGEPSGSLDLDESPGNVLMVNLSPVQALQQVRNRRSFVSDMLHWDMTLMPRGTRSKWSSNSTCDDSISLSRRMRWVRNTGLTRSIGSFFVIANLGTSADSFVGK